MERIVASATRDCIGQVWTVPAPGRHHHVFEVMRAGGCNVEWVLDSEQGFVTDTGRYVNRVEAKTIAEEADQILDNTTPILKDLYSENLW